ncbi:MAG TPA: PH domain-containing protein [Candidatus Saccharimonadales bacterium]|nr:PH domain-containing protein [Candidatus Saccharimonadales bacterium]
MQSGTPQFGSVLQPNQEDPHGLMPGFSTPAEESHKKQMLGEQPIVQAEKLLSKPIPIPRNPWALVVQLASVVFLADILVVVALLAISTATAHAPAAFMLVAIGVLSLKAVMVIAFILKMSLHWVPDNYEITERQLIKKKGIANKEDKIYELANIRHVTVHESFIGRQLEYGDIELLVATAGLNEIIRLTDVKDPHHFEEVFTEYLG